MDSRSTDIDAGQPAPLAALPVYEGAPWYEAIRALYEEAFPPEERFPWPDLLLLAREDGVEFLAYFDAPAAAPGSDVAVEMAPDSNAPHRKPCGLSYTIVAESFLYILFLAVDPHTRGQGYGTRILDSLCTRYPNANPVLEIEPIDPAAPNYEQRLSRLRFYERNGFAFTGYDLVEETERYTMLARDPNFDPSEFARAVRKATCGTCLFSIEPSR